MRTSIFTFLAILLFWTSSARAEDKRTAVEEDHISAETASKNAMAFLRSSQGAANKIRGKAPVKSTDLTLCVEHPNMYVFNVGQSEGFVVASASSLTRPVLCYSTDGQWDEESMQQSLGWLFKQYDAEIAYARQNGVEANGQTIITKSPIEPLIKTRWDQSVPYNNKLPTFTWGGQTMHVVTGCVATAMGQIMNYHQWPKTIKEKIPGYNHGQLIGDDANEVVMDDIPAGTVIDWEHMNGGQINNSAAEDAVSDLMKYCGTAVRMYYGEFTSSSHNLSAMYALKHYFDYDPTIYIAERSNYSYYDWCNMLYEELQAGRPIMYNGQSVETGHSFIVDGYDGNEMFHFNLGWGDQRSSIYAILSSVGHDSSVNNLNAYDSPDGYVYHQTAMMNVQKSGLTQGIYRVSLNGYIEAQEENQCVICTYYNNEDEAYTFDLGIGYRDEKGNIQVVKATENVTIEMTSFSSPVFEVSSLSLPQGTYRLLPIARLSGGKSAWEFVTNELDYQLATVSAQGEVTLTSHQRKTDLKVDEIKFSGHPYADQELYVFCKIKNEGEADYFDKLYFFWNDNPANKGIDAGHFRLWSHATINVGGTAPVEFYFTPDKAGEYTVWITTDAEGEHVVGQSTVSIGDEMPFKVDNKIPVNITNVKIANLQDGVILGSDVVVDFDVTNPSSTDYFYGMVTMATRCYYSGTWKEVQSEAIRSRYEIAPGQTRHFQLSIPDLYSQLPSDPRNLYFYVILYTGTWSDAFKSSKCTIENAVMTYTPDGVKTPVKAAATITIPESAGAVDFTQINTQMTTVVPNSNPNTIYYLSENANVPNGLKGKNIVIGNQAEKIVLDGAYGVAVPKEFQAKSVSFTKQLKKDKCSTLCLPFSAPLSNTQVEIGAITDEDATHIHTNTVKEITAYQTCFIKSKSDGEQTFTGSDVTFPKQGNAISTINNFKAQGVMGNTTVKDVYVLNNEGTALSLSLSAEIPPFTSFFMVTTRGYVPSSSISLDFDDTPIASGIHNVTSHKEDVNDGKWYKLDGQQLSGKPMQKGVYLFNGKKVIIK